MFTELADIRECHILPLLIKPNTSEIIANTNSMWIIPPALYANAPTSHPMIKITATKYKILLIVLFV